MAKRVTGTLALENVQPMRGSFLNFSGRETQFNPAGRKNFCAILPDEETAQRLSDIGWKVKHVGPNENNEMTYYMPVAVRFDIRPPKVWMITCREDENDEITPVSRVLLNEDTISSLDWLDIISMDVTLTPYNWENNGQHGCKAYLKSMYVRVAEDPFEAKYADMLSSDVDDLPF